MARRREQQLRIGRFAVELDDRHARVIDFGSGACGSCGQRQIHAKFTEWLELLELLERELQRRQAH